MTDEETWNARVRQCDPLDFPDVLWADAEIRRLREAVLCLYAHCNKTERENFREEFKDIDAGLRRAALKSAK